MVEYVFYCMVQFGYFYKVVLMLELCGVDWELNWVDFFNGEICMEVFWFILNEMGEVLVFVYGDRILI